MNKTRPKLPVPGLLREPTGPYGWLEDRLLKDEWLAELGPDATSVLVLLALAADRHGASFYGRNKMSRLLGLSPPAIDESLRRLVERKLVAHQPWKPGHPDGVWQLLPIPQSETKRVVRGGSPASLHQVIKAFTT